MRRLALILPILAALACPAAADKVTLKDGRVIEGTVTESEGRVLIDVPNGTLSFASSDIDTILRMPTPQEQLNTQLARIDRSDPLAVFKMAQWAAENNLSRQANDLLHDVLSLDPNHADARRLLGFVKVDGQWQDLPTALKLAKNKLEAGKFDAVAALVAPLDAAANADGKIEVKDLEANWHLQAGEFDKARACYEDLAGRTTAGRSARYAAIVTVLKQHADGMVTVKEPYPPQAALLGDQPPELQPGPASLTRPMVLEAALHELAKDALCSGKAMLEEGKKLESAEPEAAKNRYAAAVKSFDTADAIMPRISRSYRVEIIRRKIGLIGGDMTTEANKYDALKEELGKETLTPAGYTAHLNRMLRALTNVKSDLDGILEMTQPYEQELVLEIADANLRLQRVNALRELLAEELRAK